MKNNPQIVTEKGEEITFTYPFDILKKQKSRNIYIYQQVQSSTMNMKIF